MTAINYVRNLAGGGVAIAHFRQALPPTGAAARVHRSQALRSLRRPPHRWWWGVFAALEAGCRRVTGVSWF